MSVALGELHGLGLAGLRCGSDFGVPHDRRRSEGSRVVSW